MAKAREPEELLRERRERLERAYTNRTPDRVPFTPLPAPDLAARHAGVSTADLCFNWDTQVEVAARWGSEFNVEGVDSLPYFVPGLEMFMLLAAWVEHPEHAVPARFLMGPFHDALRDRYTRWPGRELPADFHPQFVGGKFMEADEYGRLAEDPIGFLNGVILPRVFQALSRPSSPEAYAALMRLGVEILNFGNTMARIGVEAAKLGYPSFPMGWGYAPLDFIGDFLRHPTNTMLDLRRRPGDVHAALEALTPLIKRCIRVSTPPPEKARELFGTGVVQVFYPLHLNEMLPPRLFEEFYWPGLKEVIAEAINAGATPWVFVEGDFTPFLGYLEELPRGRVIAWFEKTDLRKVREVLGDHVVVAGGLPLSVFIHGSREEVYEEACRLLRDVKEPGGFVFMGAQGSPTAATRIENIWAAIEAVKRCGVY